ncbi:cytochrome P450 [Sphingobium bisphenolivorans]|uniref:cytochrome P450 n=1 Tax=Sphingobium bisphenolivorans TaxID=1335760 RepID=UPI00039F8FDB|nr:cytochrome P450 [Sphingobium bisphenolivorans]
MGEVESAERFIPPLVTSGDLPDVVVDIDKSYYQHLDELREKYPAVRLPRRDSEIYVFLRAEEARFVLSDFEHFTNRKDEDDPYIEDNLLPSSMDPPEHTKYRNVLQPFFTPRAVRELEDGMKALANRLIDGFVADGSCEFIEAFGKPYPCLIFCQLLDLPLEDVPYLVEHEALVWTPPAEDPDRSLNRRGMEVLRNYLYDQIKQRRVKPRNGLFDAMLDAEVDDRKLTDYEIVMMALLLCLGGFHTTKGALSRQFIHLARHPEDRRHLRENPELFPRFVEEMIRIYSMGETFRIVKKDFVLGGVELKKGMLVSAHKPAANRDPRLFENSKKIDLSRPSRHVGFGAGPHMCLGLHVARTDMRIALQEWHKRIPDYRMPDGFVVQEQLFAGVGPLEVPLIWR